MAFPNGQSYLYSQPTSPQSVLVRTSIVPVVEIISAPANITNSLQATFVVRVLDRDFGTELYVANLYYKLDSAPAYTTLGDNRQISISVGEGSHSMSFTADMNGTPPTTPLPPYTWTVDTARPTIVAISPFDGATHINISPTITVEFSENMKSSVTAAALSISPSVAGSWAGSGNIFTFSATENLAYNSDYTITVASQASDLGGNLILQGGSATFRTVQESNQLPSPPNFSGLYVPTASSSTAPRFVFNVPADLDNDALHFTVEIASNDSFTSGFLTYNTINNPNSFIHYSTEGIKTFPFPGNGVASGGGKVVFKTPVSLADGRYWYRFFSDDRR